MLAVVSLSACSQTTDQTQASSKESVTSHSTSQSLLKATITVTDYEKKETKTDVEFEEGQSLMEVLKAHFTIVEENGLITSINGVSQDKDKGIYWMYKVNNEMASVGAKDFVLKNGDTVQFYQEKY
ncbi:Additional lipoprotein component of putative cobalamin ECF transporter [Streptococcus sp. DD13]|nr:Additional lipoprotein component of putative cobalamin ECF transporter [Streptococcus sp. DD13]